MDRPVLALSDVSLSFGEARALSSLSLRVSAGEVYALLGPNGAGKTTTLNLILGFLKPGTGTIHVDGVYAITDPIKGAYQARLPSRDGHASPSAERNRAPAIFCVAGWA